MKFFNTIHCDSSVHCLKCRDLAGGRVWRESLKQKKVDFKCPKNYPWGFRCDHYYITTGKTFWSKSCKCKKLGLAGKEYLYEKIKCQDCNHIDKQRVMPIQFK